MPGILWVVFYLFPQAIDENVSILPFLGILRSPHFAQQHTMGKNFVYIKHQFLEKIIFGRCQYNLAASHGYSSLGKVNLKDAAILAIMGVIALVLAVSRLRKSLA